jgi:hypothetical protein
MAHREHDWVTGERGQVAEATVHGEAAWWLRLTGEKEGDGYAGIPGGMGGSEANKAELFAQPKTARRRQRRAAELWRWRKQRRKKRERWWRSGFIAEARQRGSDTRWATAHAEQEVATAGAPKSRPKAAGIGREVAPCRWSDFKLITKMPLKIIPKLL